MTTQQELWYLRKADLMKRLSKEEIDLLYANSQRIYKERGEEFWNEDEESAKVYIVDQGFLRVCRMSDDGKRFILAMLGPGDFFGAVTPGSAGVDTDEYWEVVRNVRLISISAPIFHKTICNHPEMTFRLLQIMDGRKRFLEKRISSILFKDVCARTAELLLEFTEKYGEPCTNHPGQAHKTISLTHQEIADLVGAARPVVSGLISDMIKAHALDKEGRQLCLSDYELMQDLAESGVKALGK